VVARNVQREVLLCFCRVCRDVESEPVVHSHTRVRPDQNVRQERISSA
jgi:hypothetical protein